MSHSSSDNRRKCRRPSLYVHIELETRDNGRKQQHANAASSTDFEVPEHYIPQLVEEMARLIGINLRDAAVSNYGQQQPQQR